MSDTPAFVADSYHWHEHWATLPDTPQGKANGRTHGVCVRGDGAVVVFAQTVDGLLTYDPDGKLISAVGGDRWLGAHGLTKILENGTEYLWLCDQESAEVAKVTMDGQTVQKLPKPEHALYHGDDAKRYVPTWAAQHPVTGEIWVADGYGASLIHRFDSMGQQMQSYDGAEGAGRFACPHGINFRIADQGKVELFITDRGNKRIVIYDDNANLLRQSSITHSPCCFDFLHNWVLVPELSTGAKVLDVNSLELLGEIGVAQWAGIAPEYNHKTPEGWPNLAGTQHVHAGAFNSPHGGCFAPNGDIYIVEWIVGGRITKLQRQ
ncbi:MAG TPA: hypothetical protein DCM28_23500 [Phycisphaerales bacterium]|nr:hypothetical protein [Phycisphaerales bacterium]HCD31410.1 hypothetical protein [Phycisphaerales bacterium]|tara:strand:+ start:873 stop:1835 length:963 start_codon:yes stop_codon:yes gene_type:complete